MPKSRLKRPSRKQLISVLGTSINRLMSIQSDLECDTHILVKDVLEEIKVIDEATNTAMNKIEAKRDLL